MARVNSLGASPLSVNQGGTASSSVIFTPTPSSWAGWNVNSNFSANNLLEGYTATVTAAGTTTLTVASTAIQVFTGSTTQTLVMPVTSTLALGQSWLILNSSSGVVTVQSSGLNTIQAMAAGTKLTITCVSLSGTGTASWRADYSFTGGGVSSIAGTANQIIASASTGPVTLSLPQNIATTSNVTFGSLTTTNMSFDVTANAIKSTNTDGNIFISPNGSGYSIFGTATTNPLSISTPDNALINYGNPGTRPGNIVSTSFISATNYPAGVTFVRSRSNTLSSNAALQVGDAIGLLDFRADTGSSIASRAVIGCAVTAVAANIGTQLTFYTSSSASGSAALAMTISDAQVITLANALLPASGGTGTTVAPSAGQIPIGTSGNVYTPAAINSGTGIVVANGSGSITVSATGAGMSWTTTSGTTQSVAVDNGYISGNAAQSTFTLPAIAAIGSVAAVEGLGSGGWILAANTGQTIKIGSGTTSSAGSLTSVAASDNVYVTCIVANTTWRVRTTNSAGLTIS